MPCCCQPPPGLAILKRFQQGKHLYVAPARHDDLFRCGVDVKYAAAFLELVQRGHVSAITLSPMAVNQTPDGKQAESRSQKASRSGGSLPFLLGGSAAIGEGEALFRPVGMGSHRRAALARFRDPGGHAARRLALEEE